MHQLCCSVTLSNINIILINSKNFLVNYEKLYKMNWEISIKNERKSKTISGKFNENWEISQLKLKKIQEKNSIQYLQDEIKIQIRAQTNVDSQIHNQTLAFQSIYKWKSIDDMWN